MQWKIVDPSEDGLQHGEAEPSLRESWLHVLQANAKNRAKMVKWRSHTGILRKQLIRTVIRMDMGSCCMTCNDSLTECKKTEQSFRLPSQSPRMACRGADPLYSIMH